MICNQCGAENADNAKFCNQCGQELIKPTASDQRLLCDKCGTENPKGSVFCNECGQKIDPKPSQTLDDERGLPIEEEKAGCTIGCWPVLLGIVIVILPLALLLFFGSGGSFRADATLSDVDIDYELDVYNLALDLVIVPECKIKDLEITFTFYDENNHYLFDIEKNVGHVKAGEAVRRKITLFDFDSKVFKVDKVRVQVSEGTKSIFN